MRKGDVVVLRQTRRKETTYELGTILASRDFLFTVVTLARTHYRVAERELVMVSPDVAVTARRLLAEFAWTAEREHRTLAALRAALLIERRHDEVPPPYRPVRDRAGRLVPANPLLRTHAAPVRGGVATIRCVTDPMVYGGPFKVEEALAFYAHALAVRRGLLPADVSTLTAIRGATWNASCKDVDFVMLMEQLGRGEPPLVACRVTVSLRWLDWVPAPPEEEAETELEEILSA